jgi:phospholipase C
VAVAGVFLAGILASNGAAGALTTRRLPRTFDHLVVIYEENHSFDNLWGIWPGVNGVTGRAAALRTRQVDQSPLRKPLTCVEQNDVNLTSPPLAKVCSGSKADGSPFDSHFRVKPFKIDDSIPPSAKTCYDPTPPAAPSGPTNGVPAGGGVAGGCTRDLVHRFYQEQFQIDGGRQDRYVTGSDAVGLSLGYYDTTRLPFYQYMTGRNAPPYVIDDNFFASAFGGSFLNHQWLVSATTPLWPGGADRSGVQTGCATGTANCDLHSLVDANGMPKTYDLYKTTGTKVVPTPTVADNPLTEAGTTPTGRACAVTAGAVRPPLGTACGDYAVNTIQSSSQPYPPGTTVGKRLPLLTTPNIGDRLSAKGVSWAWFAGGWDNAAGYTDGPGWTNGGGPACGKAALANSPFPYCPDPLFQFHHQPFNYYDKYKATPDGAGHETNPRRLEHLRDEQDFLTAAHNGTMPAVSFVKPIGHENEHPGYTGIQQGDTHLVELIGAIQASPQWKSTMVVVTYDEFGGSWDHVPPPRADKWGPGTRIPAIVISPLLPRKAAVDHARYDTTSILATIEKRWGVAPFGHRDATIADVGRGALSTRLALRIR